MVSNMSNKLTDDDIKIILDEKPYIIDTAIHYADMLSEKYKHLYCVVKSNKSKMKRYDIISFGFYRDNIPNFELYYISKFKGEKI